MSLLLGIVGQVVLCSIRLGRSFRARLFPMEAFRATSRIE